MKNDDRRKSEGAPERSLKAGVGVPSGVDGNSPKRFSVQRKMAIVARLLRGEPLELVAPEANVRAHGRLWPLRQHKENRLMELTFLPGQYVNIVVPEKGEQKRSWSAWPS